jgi:hypothetical protein
MRTTKGPWVHKGKCLVYSKKGRLVADCCQADERDPVETAIDEANAELVQTAPELLEFTKTMASYFETNPNGYQDFLKTALKLIAKAEGKK